MTCASCFASPNITSGNLIDLITYGNTVTGDVLGIIFLLIIFFVMFISMKRYPTEKAFVGAAFTTAISSYLFNILGVLSGNIVSATTVILLAAIALLFIRD